jgi:hypothetical protein
MAKREQIKPYYDRKVQLEQFEPISFGAGSVVTLEEDDDAAEVMAEELRFLEDAVERELTRRIARKKADSGDE